MTGVGTRVWADGRAYTGDFVVGEMHGEGVHTLPSGERYAGTMRNNWREGRGVLTGAGVSTGAGGVVYDGDFARHRPNGRGRSEGGPLGEIYEGVGAHRLNGWFQTKKLVAC
jgi:hypothetical protein